MSPPRFVVCGDDPLAHSLVDELTSRYDAQVTVILPSRDRNHGPQLAAIPKVRIVEADRLDAEAFQSARLARANGLALVQQDDVGNIHAALRAQELHPRLRLVIRMFNMSLGHGVRRLFNDCAVLSDASMAAPELVAAALGEVAPNFVRLIGRTLYVARRADVHQRDVVCGIAATGGDRPPEVLPADDAKTDLVLAVANRRRGPARAARRVPILTRGPVRGDADLAGSAAEGAGAERASWRGRVWPGRVWPRVRAGRVRADRGSPGEGWSGWSRSGWARSWARAGWPRGWRWASRGDLGSGDGPGVEDTTREQPPGDRTPGGRRSGKRASGGRTPRDHPRLDHTPLDRAARDAAALAVAEREAATREAVDIDDPQPVPAPRRHRRSARRRRRFLALPRALLSLVDSKLEIATMALAAIFVSGVVAIGLIDRVTPWQALYTTMIIAADAGDPDLEMSLVRQVTQAAVAVAGIAMVPVLTATVVNAAVNARLAAVVGRLRTPIAGHLVVIGLGNVGTRVIRMLHELGHEVVAIDKSSAARGARLARELDIPLIIGDASEEETLRQASVRTCEALLALSTSDVANLEAALHARTLRPGLRVVMRLFDGDFARRVQRAFDIPISRSVSSLAAPAFAAALLEREVVGTIAVQRRVLLIAEVLVTEGSPLVGEWVAGVARAGEVRVIALMGAREHRPRWTPSPDTPIGAGDRLIVIANRTGLSRVLARTGPPPHPNSAGDASI